jgi:hypothetical protein
MAAKRKSIDRRIVATPDDTRVVMFRADTRRYDLTKLPTPADITTFLYRAFIGHYTTAQAATQRHCWDALKAFGRFVAQDKSVRSMHDMTTAMVGRYKIWLDSQKTRQGEPFSPVFKHHQMSALRQLVDWTKRNHPQSLLVRIDFPYNPFPDRQSNPRPCLSEAQLKVILRACYEEIDDAWMRFQTGQKILASTGPVEGCHPSLCECVRGMAAVSGGVMPTMLELLDKKVGVATVNRNGGLRVAASYLHLTPEKLAAFFIAIAIQTAGNPDAIRQLRRNCQVPHPLDDNRITIDWSKGRAGGNRKRAQRRSFDRRLPYAAPILIERVLAMTEPLRAQAEPQVRDRLFLVKSEKTGQVSEIAVCTLGMIVKRFVARANPRIVIWNEAAPERHRDSLPDFAAVFLRGSVATQHYKSSGGDILVVQEILNHKNAHTSDAYVRGPEVQKIQTETIARLQGLMIAWVTAADVPLPKLDTVVGERATAPFGHDCLNPMAGIAAGSQEGRVCPRFGGCLRCPCLVIPLDAVHLARILQAKAALEIARLQLDPQRWALLYAPSYRVLVDEILPDFAGGLYPEAQALIPTLPQLPVIE